MQFSCKIRVSYLMKHTPISLFIYKYIVKYIPRTCLGIWTLIIPKHPQSFTIKFELLSWILRRKIGKWIHTHHPDLFPNYIRFIYKPINSQHQSARAMILNSFKHDWRVFWRFWRDCLSFCNTSIAPGATNISMNFSSFTANKSNPSASTSRSRLQRQ